MAPKISLITMTQGNPHSLKRTLDSFKNICDEFVVGDQCVFDDDREKIKECAADYNLQIIPFAFNFIYKNGFSTILNALAKEATNDLVLYMNVGELVDGEERILKLIEEKFSAYNCYAMCHGIETHSWYRMYDKRDCWWEGIIHEELRGHRNDCPYYIFQFKDSEKDNENPFRARVYNAVKEMVYFKQYIRLVEEPGIRGITNEWWLNFAQENYESMKHRLFDMREKHEAFEEGNFDKFIRAINEKSFFDQEEYKSTQLVEFQGSTKSL